MKSILDLDDPADRRIAGATLLNLVASDAWPLIRQIAVYIREKDVEKFTDTMDTLHALNGRQAGMKALLDFIDKLAKAVVDAPAPGETRAKTMAADVISTLRTAVPGSGPI